ncbi:MAG TPA: DUF4349 domain-containing protein [Solirubrobacterales bacterium]|jgi:hypothetical protein
MKPFSEMGDSELAAALHSLRPEPSPAFATELDQRAAAGFPRRSRGRRSSPLAHLLARSPGRLALGGFAAIVLIALVTTVVVSSGGGGEPGAPGSGSESGPSLQAAPNASGGEASVGGEEEAATRAEMQAPETAGGRTVHGPAALAKSHRQVEHAADITIGTKPDEVGGASSQVFEAVHRYGGTVLNSSTQNGSGTQAEASFELLIPSGKVDDAMAAFSQIGEVIDRHETTNDITAPTVGAAERLQDSEARIEGLLAQLSEATTESEREVVEAELDSERHHAAHLKSKLSHLHQRADLSRVSVKIVGGKSALAPGASGGDSWGAGKALGDAGHLLSVAAGVVIVGFAVLAPLMLLLLLAWLAGHAWTRRARERALT